jgi:hypothetical protein
MKMKQKNKIFLITIALAVMQLCLFSSLFAQQNMQNMPGMNMSKTKTVKKQVTKQKVTQKKPVVSTKDTMPDVDMKMPGN